MWQKGRHTDHRAAAQLESSSLKFREAILFSFLASLPWKGLPLWAKQRLAICEYALCLNCRRELRPSVKVPRSFKAPPKRVTLSCFPSFLVFRAPYPRLTQWTSPCFPRYPPLEIQEWKHYIRAGCFHNTPSLGSKVSLLTERSFITPPFISRTFPGKIHFWLFHPCFLTSSLRTLWSCRTECQLCERHHPWY